MSLTIVSWNINSLLPRLDVVARLLRDERPDVLCLQKVRAAREDFPRKAFEELGYPHIALRDQGTVAGLAILSRMPIAETSALDIAGQGEARHLFARLANGIGVHNLYVPAGGAKPDAANDAGFKKKLDFLAFARDHFRDVPPRAAMLMGDLNIAPLPEDVYDHPALRTEVTHTDIEAAALAEVRTAGGWVDLLRQTQPKGAMYSWWSYRWWNSSTPVGSRLDKGRLLDHIWGTADLAARLHTSGVNRVARDWKGGSDHAPVFATLDL